MKIGCWIHQSMFLHVMKAKRRSQTGPGDFYSHLSRVTCDLFDVHLKKLMCSCTRSAAIDDLSTYCIGVYPVSNIIPTRLNLSRTTPKICQENSANVIAADGLVPWVAWWSATRVSCPLNIDRMLEYPILCLTFLKKFMTIKCNQISASTKGIYLWSHSNRFWIAPQIRLSRIHSSNIIVEAKMGVIRQATFSNVFSRVKLYCVLDGYLDKKASYFSRLSNTQMPCHYSNNAGGLGFWPLNAYPNFDELIWCSFNSTHMVNTLNNSTALFFFLL